MQQKLGKLDKLAVYRIVTFYILFSSLWKYLTDAVLFRVIDDQFLLTQIEICKGIVFILTTAVILYFIICRSLLRTADPNRRLQSIEEQFQAVCDNLFEAVLILNAETGEIIEANGAMCSMFGSSRSEAIQLAFRGLSSGHSSNLDAAVKERLSRAFREAPQFFEWQARKKNGDLFWAEISMQKVAMGKEAKVIALVRDVTERKRSEEKLRLTEFSINNVSDAVYCCTISERKVIESELKDREARFRLLSQEFQALLNGIPDGLTLLSPDLTVLWVNSTMAQAMGMEQSAIIGRHCFELWHRRSVPCRKCPVQVCFATGKPEMSTFRNEDGMTIELRVVAVKDDNGTVIKVIQIGRDITEQKNLEHQLHHSQKMEAVGQLAGGVAHDFNNILTATIGFATLMLMKMEPNNPLRHYAEQILSSSEKAAILTQSLLAFSRKKVMSLQPTDLNEVIKNGQKLLQRLIREDIEFKLELRPEALTVMADSVQLEQVFMNLVSNARDAMRDGGVVFIKTEQFFMDTSFTHSHGYGKPGRYACISVSDTGGGMDEKTMEKIFEPFFTTKEVGKGTGLGLAMVYGIIKQHNGFIKVHSEPGHGTTFKLYLPLVSVAVAENEKTVSAYLRGSEETVLLAEDDENVRKANREILENFGYNVIEATDGEDAIDKFAGNKDRINLLILDVIMPKRNGREVYETARKIRADVKALFISGYTADFFAQKGFLDNSLHFIEKPVSPEKLLLKISEVLNN